MFPVFLYNRHGLVPNGKNIGLAKKFAWIVPYHLTGNPNKLFGQSSTKLPFFLLKEIFHADLTHVLPSKASQPNLLHGASSEVHQAEREPRFLITLSGGFHSLLRVQASRAQRAWLSSLFPQEMVRTQAFPISCSTRSEEEGCSEHRRKSSARPQVPKPFYCLFLQEAGLPR